MTNYNIQSVINICHITFLVQIIITIEINYNSFFNSTYLTDCMNKTKKKKNDTNFYIILPTLKQRV